MPEIDTFRSHVEGWWLEETPFSSRWLEEGLFSSYRLKEAPFSLLWCRCGPGREVGVKGTRAAALRSGTGHKSVGRTNAQRLRLHRAVSAVGFCTLWHLARVRGIPWPQSLVTLGLV